MKKKILLLILIFPIMLAAVTGAWFRWEYTKKVDGPENEIGFEVPPGASVSLIAEKLREQKILEKTWPFLWGYRIFHSRHSLKAGEYRVQLPASPKEILSTLVEGKIYLRALTIPEGLTLQETAEHLEQEYQISESEFIHAASRAAIVSDWDPEAENLEGYLFPETYRFPKNTSPAAVVETMVTHFEQVFTEAWRKQAAVLGLTMREVATLASLIEKETSLPEERSLVSGVFHNRLRIGMKLDCDPTVVYALKQAGRYRGRLWTRDLTFDSPYNTYRYPGLPPGPIANPGKASLEAALYPADVDYLYFVAKDDSSHHFSRTFREHQNAVNQYRRR